MHVSFLNLQGKSTHLVILNKLYNFFAIKSFRTWEINWIRHSTAWYTVCFCALIENIMAKREMTFFQASSHLRETLCQYFMIESVRSCVIKRHDWVRRVCELKLIEISNEEIDRCSVVIGLMKLNFFLLVLLF